MAKLVAEDSQLFRGKASWHGVREPGAGARGHRSPPSSKAAFSDAF